MEELGGPLCWLGSFGGVVGAAAGVYYDFIGAEVVGAVFGLFVGGFMGILTGMLIGMAIFIDIVFIRSLLSLLLAFNTLAVFVAVALFF